MPAPLGYSVVQCLHLISIISPPYIIELKRRTSPWKQVAEKASYSALDSNRANMPPKMFINILKTQIYK